MECSINDAHVFKGEADVLVTVLSADSAESLDFTEQVSAFRSAGGQVIFAAKRDETAALPPSLTAARGETGLLEPAPAPIEVGRLCDDDASARRVARAVMRAIGTPMRYRINQRRGALAAALALTLTSGAFGWAYWSSQAELTELKAEAELGEALLAGVASKFPSTPSADAVLALADQLESALSDRAVARATDASLVDQARLFHAIGEARDLHGEPAAAQAAFIRAHELTGEILARNPDNPDKIFAHSQSAFWAGNSAFRRGDLDTAETYWGTYDRLSQTLVEQEPDNPLYQAEAGYAANNRGILELGRGSPVKALSLFEEAISLFQAGPEAGGHVPAYEMANTQGWRGKALEQLGRFEDAAAVRAAEAAIYLAELQQDSDQPRLTARYVNALINQGYSLAALGRIDEADDRLETALEFADQLVRDHPTNIRYARNYLNALNFRARSAIWRDEPIRAQLLLNEARSFIDRTDRAGQQDDRHVERASAHLIGAELALRAGAVERARLEASDAILACEQALRANFKRANGMLATAYFVDAEARRLSGDETSASRSLRQALDRIDAMESRAENPTIRALKSQVLWRLGEVERALTLRAELDTLGYKRPDYLEFWDSADRSRSVDANQSAMGDERG